MKFRKIQFLKCALIASYMGRRFPILIPFSILDIKSRNVQYFAKYISFENRKYNYSFLGRGRSGVMILCSVLSSSKVSQCS